jgi:predicted dehydrogenase
VADIDIARAKAAAETHGVPKACSVSKLLGLDDVQIVVNLTVPKVHAKVTLAALKKGKHVYSEKPLAVTRAEGKRILQTAAEKGLKVGCAPDTMLGGGHQSARKLILDGAIGRPVAATAFMMGHGPEQWHPDPEFFYKVGGGPLFDMGPYYLTALTTMLGPVARVHASAKVLVSPRVVGSGAKKGQTIEVETPDHVAGTLEFANGAIGTIITSFAVWGAQLSRIEVHGLDGSLSVPDPNGFGGSVKLLRAMGREWQEMPLTHGYTTNFRILGVADLAMAVGTGRANRCSSEQAYHVLDVMHGLLDSARKSRWVDIASTFSPPQPLPTGLVDGQLD